MKKIFIIALVAVASVLGVKADNPWYVGGNIGYMHESVKIEGIESITNAYALMPEVGYSFNDKWGIGTVVGYKFTYLCGTKMIENMFKFAPYARFTYFRSSDNLVHLFFDGGGSIGIGWDKYEHGRSTEAITYSVGIQPGVAFNFGDRVSLVAKVGFFGYKGANGVAFNSGLNPKKAGIWFDSDDLTVGVSFHF